MVNSNRKGKTFERKIAAELREIYDTPEVLNQITVALLSRDAGAHKQALGHSVVYRSDQSKGADGPDVACGGLCPCWLELQNASPGNYNPTRKLLQAERDVRAINSPLLPVVIAHLKGKKSIAVAMRLNTLNILQDRYPGIRSSATTKAYQSVVVSIDWLDFKSILDTLYMGRYSG